jgi:Glycosyl hydrolases family 38 N-terminal domain
MVEGLEIPVVFLLFVASDIPYCSFKKQTIDGYFEDQVHYVIDTAIEALMVNPTRKFIYVEQAYFWRWWHAESTTDIQRDNLRSLVKQGRWEFVLGGWVMQDEGNVSQPFHPFPRFVFR